KDAEDVNGLEVSAGYGDGPGDKQDFRAYAMFGKTFFRGQLKIFQHLSYETYIGQVSRQPQLFSPLPWTFGPAVTPDPHRSWVVVLDGKYSLGPVSIYYSVPLASTYWQLGITPAPDSRTNITFLDRYATLEYKQRF